jgi:hypothetical protein
VKKKTNTLGTHFAGRFLLSTISKEFSALRRRQEGSHRIPQSVTGHRRLLAANLLSSEVELVGGSCLDTGFEITPKQGNAGWNFFAWHFDQGHSKMVTSSYLWRPVVSGNDS